MVQTVVLRMLTLVLRVLKSAELSAERKKPAVVVNLDRTHGKFICAVKRIPLTIRLTFLWHKGLNLIYKHYERDTSKISEAYSCRRSEERRVGKECRPR